MAAAPEDADDIAFLKIAFDCHDAFGKQALCLNSKCFCGTLIDVVYKTISLINIHLQYINLMSN